MAGTYPSYPQLRDQSTLRISTPVTWLLTENGGQRGIDLGDKRRRTWRVHHRITQAEFNTLVSLFESNQSTTGTGPGTVSFTDDRDSSVHTVEFLARPTSRWTGGTKPLEVYSELVEIS